MRGVIRSLAAMIVAFALPQGASAQQLRVQSGDHAGFTRLVLPIGADRDWTLEPDGGEVWRLALDPDVDGFDTSGAFDLIQRDRLASLEAGDDLRLNLACPCDVSSFRHNDQYLVIDIADPDPNAEPPAPDPDDTPDPRELERAEAAAALPNLARLLTQTGPGGFAPADPVAPEPIATPDIPADPPLDPPDADANPRIAEAAAIMAEQLARAAAAGLLDVDIDQPQTAADPVAAPEPEIAEAAPEPETMVEAPDPALDPSGFPAGPLPIRAENALDIDIGRLTPSARTPGACEGAPVPLRDWAEGPSFHDGLGTLRAGLYDDRDALVPSAAEDMARHYLHFGFGAEASYWLRQTPSPPDDLLHIAALVDGADAAPFPAVEIPTDCSEGELLWRYLAQAVTAELTSEDVSALQRGFTDLPTGMRDHIGPRLARQMYEDGYAGTARNIRDALHRGGRLSAVELRLLDLDLGLSPDRFAEETRAALADALRDDGSNPVAIMAAALAFDRDVGVLPDADRLTAAEALLREAAGGPETDALWQEVLVGHAALGQIDRAMDMLGDPGRSDTARMEAITSLIAERVSVDDTAALLIIAYRYGRIWQPQGSAAGRAQVQAIAALREAGLYRAANILTDNRRPLILPTPDSPVVAVDPVDSAWEEGDWPALAEAATGPHGTIAGRMTDLTAEDAPPPPTDLTALAAQVGDSAQLRSEIVALLADPTPR